MLSAEDFNKLHTVIKDELQPIREELNSVDKRLDTLTTSVDEFLHIVRRHDEEWLVLRAQHVKMRDVLIRKGIATESELAATS